VGGGVISFLLLSVTNPDEGETDGFKITTSLGGTELDITDTSSTKGRTFISYKKTIPIKVNSLSCAPKNEGEEAAYNFVFFTTNSLD
jgi:hypothetical protein